MVRVLVTRPEPGAARTAQRLAELGFMPLMLPLSRTVSLPARLPEGVDFAGVAATSANGLRHADASILARLRHLPLYAVGTKTASLATSQGFSRIKTARGDALSLAHLIVEDRQTAALAYLCGRVRLSGFEAVLREAGVEVAAIETYDTMTVQRETREIAGLLGSQPINAALIYSAKAAGALREIVDKMGGIFENTHYICISARVAEGLAGLSKVDIARRPDEDAMFTLLAR
ncbi:uroporphyrinogen-III synthase [Oryzicola mucosus]|uniref:Uroporphyrinogen-III synthase n=1 Tax=Oryzicola mucosus TaxID=2767425 RepID=A0A8J6PF46_9HYPH|nr:uroporphyrinogen-III synthase [Oryzicola mucosus]MBD0413944.1 uroporphyrinogen-III synthase [Oryzicola mucosus]